MPPPGGGVTVGPSLASAVRKPGASPSPGFWFTDTPWHKPGPHACSNHDERMSDFGRRASRPQNAPTVLLQGRVLPETRQAFKDAAEASGVSVAYYLDALARELLAQGGSLPLVEDPRRLNRTELPIPAA